MRILIFGLGIGVPVLAMIFGGIVGWLIGHDMGVVEGYQLGYKHAQALLNW